MIIKQCNSSLKEDTYTDEHMYREFHKLAKTILVLSIYEMLLLFRSLWSAG